MNPLFAVLYFICIAAVAQPSVEQTARIYISKDQGANWERADKGFPADGVVNAWEVKDGIVIVGTNTHGIFISSDRVKTWYPSSKGLPKNTRIISVAAYKNILFAGTYKDGLFSSDDRGESWHTSSTGLKNSTIRCLHTHGPLLFVGTNDGIYSSTDNGNSWAIVKHGFQVNSFSSVKNQIFAASNQGVLASQDFGKTWDWIFNEGAINTLAANEREIYLMDYFGTVFKSDISDFIWLKADMYLPFHYTFQLTPASSKFLTIAWKGAFRDLNGANGIRNGLPEDAAFTELLDTPFGLLAGSVLPKTIE